MDFNKDRSVSAKEMQRWIMEKTEEHFQEAMVENKNSFRAVDPDGDGERENHIRLEFKAPWLLMWAMLLLVCPKLMNIFCLVKT